MLARKHSLTGTANFELVKKEGRVVPSTSFSVAILNRRDKEPSKFGFIVSTKISPASSRRNRAKRALSEGVRLQAYLIKNGYDVVFLAKPIILKKYTNELMAEVGVVLKKAGLKK